MHFQRNDIFAVIAATFAINVYAADSAATSTPTPPATTAIVTKTSTPTSGADQVSRLSSQYSTWAGSTANAQSLVSGLRNGAPITLTPTTGLTDTVTFTPPTQNMGWGNVTKALSLAQADLAAAGIANPSPQQLQIALTGGDITTISSTGTQQTTHMDGILTMRSQGMGWGQIAHKLDLQTGATFKPVSVADKTAHSGFTPDNHDTQRAEIEHDAEHRAITADGTAASKSGRVTTAAGQSNHTDHAHSARESQHVETHTARTPITRVVTAAGTPVSSGATFGHTEHGSTHAIEVQHVSHITTASGGGISALNGQGGGHGKSLGHGKD